MSERYEVTIDFDADSLADADNIAYELWRESAGWYLAHCASLSDAREVTDE